MKRKHSVSKSVLSFCLAAMLLLQAVTFSAPVFAESELVDSGSATVSESGSLDATEPSEPEAENDAPDGPASEGDAPTATEPSVTEAVYDVQAAVPIALTAGPADKTAEFIGANSTFPLEVTQGNAVIDPNGIIQGRQPFTLKSEGLKVPVNGDDDNPTNADPDLYIQKGDWIELKRDDYFKEVVLPTATKPLMATTEFGLKQLGTAYFTPNSIKIVFDGDDSFFNGIGKGVTFGFETTANSDVTGIDYGDSKEISIFGGAYQLKNPDVTPAYTITKRSNSNASENGWIYSAAFIEGAIEWRVDIAATDKFDPAIPLPLDGLTFYEAFDSVEVGTYVDGSLQVNGEAVTPDSGTANAIAYTFPEDFGDKATVTFKTWIPKAKYYHEYRSSQNAWQTVANRAELRDASDNELQTSNSWRVAFKPDWIQAAASYDHASETITWTVTVNYYNKKGLRNLTVTSELPTGLDFESATWQTWVDGVASGETSITPDTNGVYTFGDVDGKVELIIKSKVQSGSSFRIDPRANWDLDTPDGMQNNDAVTGLRPNAVTDEAAVTVGAHTFTKSGSISMEDYNLGGVTWTVNLTPQYALPNAVVYDVLVHGGDLNVLDNAVDVTGEVDKTTIAKIKANSTGSYTQLWRQYQKGTLKSTNNDLILKAIPLTVDGEVVADLIKVTGYTDPGRQASFSFRSVVTNPDILFRQNVETSKWQYNRALLFDGETVKTADTYVALHIRMLNKDMLAASYPIKKDGTADTWYIPNNVHRYIGYDGTSSGDEYTLAGYDRTTKTVTFRLSVNMPGYNTVEMEKDGGSRVITNVKLVDTLPVGWEFVPFSDEKEFELWKGLASNSSTVRNNAVSIIEPNDPAHVVSFSHSGNVGTFTFSELEGPYVILVKARPSNAALEKYLEEYITNGTDRQVLYNKADLHMTWGGVEKVVTEQRKVIVPIQTLGKSVTKPVPGVLEWTVNYTPPFNMEQGVFLQDTIGANMNLRYDENRKPVLTAPSMAVYPAKMTASGALEREGPALDLRDPNAEVQIETAPGAEGTTVLKFKLNDPNKFYQFVYQTEVDPSKAKAGDKMGNEVKLMGDDKLESISAKSESTLDSSDVAGSSSSNALLPLEKVDPEGNPLQGVQFTLYKKSDGTKVREEKTDLGGKLNLIFPDPGYYELKETFIDTNTWLPNTRIYQVYVGNTPGKPIWVDGIKVDSNNPLIVPTPAQGKLTITNTVEGNGSDPEKYFEFTVTFNGEGKDGEYTYKKPDNTFDKIKSGDKITLKHGESVTLPALPADLGYTVTQTDYTANYGYTTSPGDRTYSGTVENKGNHKADFVNKRYVYNLTISNTVMGNGGDKTKEFEYTVIFEETGKNGSYTYTKFVGETSIPGTIKSGQPFTLKDGETLEIVGLPKGLKYTVTQKDYSTDEYVTTPNERHYTGVMEGNDEDARFTNVRVIKGGLIISNTVKGKDDDKKKQFKYTVTFTGEGANGSYDYEKSDDSKGKIKSGDTFELTDGQTLVVQELPTYLQYTVTQDDYTQDGYVTDPKSLEHTGTIPEKKVAEAHFVNTRPYLEGVLRDNNTGEVIPNADITVTDQTGKETQTKTNEKGEYSVPAEADTDYTITYTKIYQVGGKDVPVEFTQKASVDSSVTDETVPADITAVGIVLFKQLDGTTELFNDSFINNMFIYLKDKDGKYVEENGIRKAFQMASKGTFSVEGLSEQKYTMEVRYKAETGEELLFKVTQLDVKANGELNISEELVDPYGTVYDETTGDAITGKKIDGAKVTLYYANTQRNIDNGRIPGTKVTLPPVPDFPPHDNESPEQDSDANGFYAYMVFPEADYYLVVTKTGYRTYTSDTISVDFDIVRHDVPMQPISSGGNPGGDNGADNGNNGADNGNNGADNGNNGADNGNNGADNGNNGADNGNNGADNGNNGADNGNNGADNGNNGADNGNNGADNGNNGADNGNNGADNGNNGADNGNNGADNGNNGADNGAGHRNNGLDNVPKTGDNSVSPIFYMVLALISLIVIGFCLLSNKKKKHI